MTQIKTAVIKNIKIATNMSEETIAFTGSLWINGKKAADLKNDGQGGANFAWFTDKELEKAFDAYCESLPPEPQTDEWPAMSMDSDLWISLEVSRIEEEKYWKRKCVKAMCIILKRHKEGQFIQYKGWPYSPDAAKKVREKHGDDLLEIVNERFI